MVRFDARSWLSQVSEAASLVRTEERLAAARREAMASLPSASRGPRVASSPSQDPMARVDAVVDAERASAASLSGARAEVAAARRAFAAMRANPGPVADAAVVLELVHVDGMTVYAASQALGEPRSTVRRRYELGVDWLDANGLPNVAAGRTSRLVAAR